MLVILVRGDTLLVDLAEPVIEILDLHFGRIQVVHQNAILLFQCVDLCFIELIFLLFRRQSLVELGVFVMDRFQILSANARVIILARIDFSS